MSSDEQVHCVHLVYDKCPTKMFQVVLLFFSSSSTRTPESATATFCRIFNTFGGNRLFQNSDLHYQSVFCFYIFKPIECAHHTTEILPEAVSPHHSWLRTGAYRCIAPTAVKKPRALPVALVRCGAGHNFSWQEVEK